MPNIEVTAKEFAFQLYFKDMRNHAIEEAPAIHSFDLKFIQRPLRINSMNAAHVGDPSDQRDLAVEVSLVMPCLNEELTLGVCIKKAIQGLQVSKLRGEIVVADNGSVDASIRIAESLGARIVRESQKGYGAALNAGIRAARGTIVVMADADDSYDWTAISPFVEKIRSGYDVVMGNRFRGGIMPGAMPPLHRYLGNPLLSCLSRIAFHTSIGDFHCGMRAFTKDAFFKMQLATSGMEFATEMVASATLIGLRIAEIPIKLYPDKRGRPPHLRSFRDGWRHLRLILTYARPRLSLHSSRPRSGTYWDDLSRIPHPRTAFNRWNRARQ